MGGRAGTWCSDGGRSVPPSVVRLQKVQVWEVEDRGVPKPTPDTGTGTVVVPPGPDLP